MTKCSLCLKEKTILESHIIPKFVFKWLKETGSSYLRNPSNPNIRLQDGIKEKLLCFECEQKLSVFEKWFAENIFNNYLAGKDFMFAYGEELGKFAVSLLWRIAIVSKDNLDKNENFLLEHLDLVTEAWRVYLDTGIKPSDNNEFHFFLLPDGWDGSQPNKYVSRYFARDTDGHIIKIEDECWVYVKFARFMFFGRVSGVKPTFRNTKLELGFGSTLLGQYIEYPALTEYLIGRAESIYEYAKDALSKKQQDVISEYFKNNFEKLKGLDLGKRLKDDSTAAIIHFDYDVDFKYVCDCCGKSMREPEGYVLRTFEILLSAEFFKYYFERSGLTNSKEDLDLRQQHFIHLAEQNSPWVICEECIIMFDVNLEETKKFAADWIQARGEYLPPKSDNFRQHLNQHQIEQIAYAIVTV